MPLSSLPRPRDLPRHDGPGAALSRQEVWSRRLRTFGLGFLVFFDAVYSAMGVDGRQRAAAGLPVGADDPTGGAGMLAFLIGFALTVAVMWRHRWPVQMALVGSALAAVALGPTFALIGLMGVVRWRPRRDAWWVGGLVTAATGIAVWRDLKVTPPKASFWATLVAQDGQPVGLAVPVVITVLLVGLFVGVGLWLRTRSDLRAAEVVVASEREAVTSLTDQVSRQAEREKLAREIHDGLGHNLSILSVHAGALEAMAEAALPEMVDDRVDETGVPDDVTGAAQTVTQMKESAEVVRATAARSVAELHSLLNILRNPGDADVAAPTRTLRDVRSLIDESVTAGMPLIATVYVDDGEAMDAHLAQAAYRIVQELLTNARKHAATVPVRLTMSGGPREGQLVIATANRLPPPIRPRATPGDGVDDGNAGARRGMGLTGIRERVEHYGGDMQWGLDEQAVFRVSIRLPWRESEAVNGREL